MNWLITGGCGFIGRSLVRHLTENAGHYIRIVDNFTVGSARDLGEVCSYTQADYNKCSASQGKVELVEADILDESKADALCRNIDVIVHLAANTGVGPSVDNPRYDCLNNVIGTFNYLEAARNNGVNRFVFASSGAPAGECEPPIHEELPPHPVSPYGASKLAGEGY